MCHCIYMRSVVIIFHFKSTHYISFVLIDSQLYFVWAEQKVNKKQLINISSRFTFKEDVYVVISVCTNIDHPIGWYANNCRLCGTFHPMQVTNEARQNLRR